MTLDTLTFRAVLPSDKDRIIAFTFNTWGDHEDDYIKDVFDDWAADPRGEFTAAVLAGEVVGIAKLTDMGDDEWWFEGLRIDPAYRRQGIASEFNRYHIELAERLGGKAIRYMTGGGNAGSQAIGARAGFEHIITYAAYLADASSEFSMPVQLTIEDAPALFRWIDSPLMRHLRGVYRAAWSAKTLTEAEIYRALESNLVYGLKDGAGPITAWALVRDQDEEDTEDGDRKRLRVDHFDGELDAVTELGKGMRALAATQDRRVVSAGICDYPLLVQALTEAGYTLNPDKFTLWVLELKLMSLTGRLRTDE
jgi:ribosomal protein S18 acetylase RimI-like enzyme